MSEVGRLLAGAGQQIGSAIGGIGERAIQLAIREEELRQEEFRNQLDLGMLLQRQQASALNLAYNVDRIDLLRGQLEQRGEEFRAREELRAAKLSAAESRATILQRRVEAGPEKAPTASEIGFARRQLKTFTEGIEEARGRVDFLAGELDLESGEVPSEPGGFLGIGGGKKRELISNWNLERRNLTRLETSRDELLRESEARGIDLEFGALAELPSPEEVSKMAEEDILQTLPLPVRTARP